jgi:hypothetical protein
MATLGDSGGGSVVLGRHGGTVLGACASSPSTAVVTVQGDGVILYDCEAQVRNSVPRLLSPSRPTPSLSHSP